MVGEDMVTANAKAVADAMTVRARPDGRRVIMILLAGLESGIILREYRLPAEAPHCPKISRR
ncbi:hypothetical protein [Arthrobacter sp. JCM 19049]|jgi:hypothetical protein|uniref:hypothetical protein n=1 Tax=Arthrobacter sp. JCM 19049 TaxID=1460643 RepID=UPI002436E803|nr:hypothetical protein [Arthrobacter sp. JCM 19049]